MTIRRGDPKGVNNRMAKSNAHYLFPGYLFPIQIIVIILFAFCTEYDSPLVVGVTNKIDSMNNTYGERTVEDPTALNMMSTYGMMMDATAMCVMGFGFLYGFSKFYVWSGIGMNFWLCGFCFMWCCVCKCFITSIFEGHFTPTPLNIETTIGSDLVTAAVLISFGAVYGFVSPTQLILVALIEPFLMILNEHIVVYNLHVSDAGGSLVTHTFGAYFGVAMCFAMGIKAKDLPTAHRSTTYWSDMGAMIGCIVLWMFWPSFNGAMLYSDPSLQQRVVLNTYLAICGSCATAFATSCILHKGKFEMLEIQNATLAGGVCIGMSCSFSLGPWAAVLIGCIGGVVSAAGYGGLHPALENLGITDSAGVQMLHGIPGIFGAIVAAFGVLVSTNEGQYNYMFSYYTTWHYTHECDRTRGQQFGFIIAAIFVTLGISIVGGIITGLIARLPLCNKIKHEDMLLDHDYWHVHDHHHDPREHPEAMGGTIIFNKHPGIPLPEKESRQ